MATAKRCASPGSRPWAIESSRGETLPACHGASRAGVRAPATRGRSPTSQDSAEECGGVRVPRSRDQAHSARSTSSFTIARPEVASAAWITPGRVHRCLPRAARNGRAAGARCRSRSAACASTCPSGGMTSRSGRSPAAVLAFPTWRSSGRRIPPGGTNRTAWHCKRCAGGARRWVWSTSDRRGGRPAARRLPGDGLSHLPERAARARSGIEFDPGA